MQRRSRWSSRSITSSLGPRGERSCRCASSLQYALGHVTEQDKVLELVKQLDVAGKKQSFSRWSAAQHHAAAHKSGQPRSAQSPIVTSSQASCLRLRAKGSAQLSTGWATPARRPERSLSRRPGDEIVTVISPPACRAPDDGTDLVRRRRRTARPGHGDRAGHAQTTLVASSCGQRAAGRLPAFRASWPCLSARQHHRRRRRGSAGVGRPRAGAASPPTAMASRRLCGNRRAT